MLLLSAYRYCACSVVRTPMLEGLHNGFEFWSEPSEHSSRKHRRSLDAAGFDRSGGGGGEEEQEEEEESGASVWTTARCCSRGTDTHTLSLTGRTRPRKHTHTHIHFHTHTNTHTQPDTLLIIHTVGARKLESADGEFEYFISFIQFSYLPCHRHLHHQIWRIIIMVQCMCHMISVFSVSV